MLPPPPPRRPQLPRPHLGVAVARGERSDFCESGFSRLARPSVWRGGFAAALPRRRPADNREISLFFADFGVSYCGQHTYRIGACCSLLQYTVEAAAAARRAARDEAEAKPPR